MKRSTLAGIAASWLLIAPVPIGPKPHLVEKWEMFQAGTLTAWIDQLDVAWHLAPFLILVAYFAQHMWRKRAAAAPAKPNDD